MMTLGAHWWEQVPIAGVGLIISHNNDGNDPRILTVQEDTEKPALLKEAETRSFPMETCEAGENVRVTLARLQAEELGTLSGLTIEENPAGLFEVVDGIWLLVWWAIAQSDALPTLPIEADVSDPQWESLETLTNGYNALRHGAFEPLNARKHGRRLVRQTCVVRVPS